MLEIFENHTEKDNLETKTAKTFIRCLDAIKLELI